MRNICLVLLLLLPLFCQFVNFVEGNGDTPDQEAHQDQAAPNVSVSQLDIASTNVVGGEIGKGENIPQTREEGDGKGNPGQTGEDMKMNSNGIDGLSNVEMKEEEEKENRHKKKMNNKRAKALWRMPHSTLTLNNSYSSLIDRTDSGVAVKEVVNEDSEKFLEDHAKDGNVKGEMHISEQKSVEEISVANSTFETEVEGAKTDPLQDSIDQNGTPEIPRKSAEKNQSMEKSSRIMGEKEDNQQQVKTIEEVEEVEEVKENRMHKLGDGEVANTNSQHKEEVHSTGKTNGSPEDKLKEERRRISSVKKHEITTEGEQESLPFSNTSSLTVKDGSFMEAGGNGTQSGIADGSDKENRGYHGTDGNVKGENVDGIKKSVEQISVANETIGTEVEGVKTDLLHSIDQNGTPEARRKSSDKSQIQDKDSGIMEETEEGAHHHNRHHRLHEVKELEEIKENRMHENGIVTNNSQNIEAKHSTQITNGVPEDNPEEERRRISSLGKNKTIEGELEGLPFSTSNLTVGDDNGTQSGIVNGREKENSERMLAIHGKDGNGKGENILVKGFMKGVEPDGIISKVDKLKLNPVDHSGIYETHKIHPDKSQSEHKIMDMKEEDIPQNEVKTIVEVTEEERKHEEKQEAEATEVSKPKHGMHEIERTVESQIEKGVKDKNNTKDKKDEQQQKHSTGMTNSRVPKDETEERKEESSLNNQTPHCSKMDQNEQGEMPTSDLTLKNLNEGIKNVIATHETEKTNIGRRLEHHGTDGINGRYADEIRRMKNGSENISEPKFIEEAADRITTEKGGIKLHSFDGIYKPPKNSLGKSQIEHKIFGTDKKKENIHIQQREVKKTNAEVEGTENEEKQEDSPEIIKRKEMHEIERTIQSQTEKVEKAKEDEQHQKQHSTGVTNSRGTENETKAEKEERKEKSSLTEGNSHNQTMDKSEQTKMPTSDMTLKNILIDGTKNGIDGIKKTIQSQIKTAEKDKEDKQDQISVNELVNSGENEQMEKIAENEYSHHVEPLIEEGHNYAGNNKDLKHSTTNGNDGNGKQEEFERKNHSLLLLKNGELQGSEMKENGRKQASIESQDKMPRGIPENDEANKKEKAKKKGIKVGKKIKVKMGGKGKRKEIGNEENTNKSKTNSVEKNPLLLVKEGGEGGKDANLVNDSLVHIGGDTMALELEDHTHPLLLKDSIEPPLEHLDENKKGKGGIKGKKKGFRVGKVKVKLSKRPANKDGSEEAEMETEENRTKSKSNSVKEDLMLVKEGGGRGNDTNLLDASHIGGDTMALEDGNHTHPLLLKNSMEKVKDIDENNQGTGGKGKKKGFRVGKVKVKLGKAKNSPPLQHLNENKEEKGGIKGKKKGFRVGKVKVKLGKRPANKNGSKEAEMETEENRSKSKSKSLEDDVRQERENDVGPMVQIGGNPISKINGNHHMEPIIEEDDISQDTLSNWGRKGPRTLRNKKVEMPVKLLQEVPLKMPEKVPLKTWEVPEREPSLDMSPVWEEGGDKGHLKYDPTRSHVQWPSNPITQIPPNPSVVFGDRSPQRPLRKFRRYPRPEIREQIQLSSPSQPAKPVQQKIDTRKRQREEEEGQPDFRDDYGIHKFVDGDRKPKRMWQEAAGMVPMGKRNPTIRRMRMPTGQPRYSTHFWSSSHLRQTSQNPSRIYPSQRYHSHRWTTIRHKLVEQPVDHGHLNGIPNGSNPRRPKRKFRTQRGSKTWKGPGPPQIVNMGNTVPLTEMPNHQEIKRERKRKRDKDDDGKDMLDENSYEEKHFEDGDHVPGFVKKAPLLKSKRVRTKLILVQEKSRDMPPKPAEQNHMMMSRKTTRNPTGRRPTNLMEMKQKEMRQRKATRKPTGIRLNNSDLRRQRPPAMKMEESAPWTFDPSKWPERAPMPTVHEGPEIHTHYERKLPERHPMPTVQEEEVIRRYLFSQTQVPMGAIPAGLNIERKPMPPIDQTGTIKQRQINGNRENPPTTAMFMPPIAGMPRRESSTRNTVHKPIEHSKWVPPDPSKGQWKEPLPELTRKPTKSTKIANKMPNNGMNGGDRHTFDSPAQIETGRNGLRKVKIVRRPPVPLHEREQFLIRKEATEKRKRVDSTEGYAYDYKGKPAFSIGKSGGGGGVDDREKQTGKRGKRPNTKKQMKLSKDHGGVLANDGRTAGISHLHSTKSHQEIHINKMPITHGEGRQNADSGKGKHPNQQIGVNDNVKKEKDLNRTGPKMVENGLHLNDSGPDPKHNGTPNGTHPVVVNVPSNDAEHCGTKQKSKTDAKERSKAGNKSVVQKPIQNSAKAQNKLTTNASIMKEREGHDRRVPEKPTAESNLPKNDQPSSRGKENSPPNVNRRKSGNGNKKNIDKMEEHLPKQTKEKPSNSIGNDAAINVALHPTELKPKTPTPLEPSAHRQNKSRTIPSKQPMVESFPNKVEVAQTNSIPKSPEPSFSPSVHKPPRVPTTSAQSVNGKANMSSPLNLGSDKGDHERKGHPHSNGEKNPTTRMDGPKLPGHNGNIHTFPTHRQEHEEPQQQPKLQQRQPQQPPQHGRGNVPITTNNCRVLTGIKQGYNVPNGNAEQSRVSFLINQFGGGASFKRRGGG